MGTTASILIPLYIYPYPVSQWQPLIDAANMYPQVHFTAVINPNSGPNPDPNGCPNSDYVAGIAALNALPNINTMGYVHTSSRSNCGPYGNYTCPASQPVENVKANITTYANWATLTCTGFGTTKQDVHMDSIFVDEAPGQDGGAALSYMTDIANFTRSSGFNSSSGLNSILLFNPGGATDLSYFDIADQIIILEDTQAAFDAIPDINSRNGNGKYASQSSVIIHHFSTDAGQIQNYTQNILGRNQHAFPSLFITSLPNATQTNIYADFATNWQSFVNAVNNTVNGS